MKKAQSFSGAIICETLKEDLVVFRYGPVGSFYTNDAPLYPLAQQMDFAMDQKLFLTKKGPSEFEQVIPKEQFGRNPKYKPRKYPNTSKPGDQYIENKFKVISKITIPQGTTIFYGQTARQFSDGVVGGQIQVVIEANHESLDEHVETLPTEEFFEKYHDQIPKWREEALSREKFNEIIDEFPVAKVKKSAEENTKFEVDSHAEGTPTKSQEKEGIEFSTQRIHGIEKRSEYKISIPIKKIPRLLNGGVTHNEIYQMLGELTDYIFLNDKLPSFNLYGGANHIMKATNTMPGTLCGHVMELCDLILKAFTHLAIFFPPKAIDKGLELIKKSDVSKWSKEKLKKEFLTTGAIDLSKHPKYKHHLEHFQRLQIEYEKSAFKNGEAEKGSFQMIPLLQSVTSLEEHLLLEPLLIFKYYGQAIKKEEIKSSRFSLKSTDSSYSNPMKVVYDHLEDFPLTQKNLNRLRIIGTLCSIIITLKEMGLKQIMPKTSHYLPKTFSEMPHLICQKKHGAYSSPHLFGGVNLKVLPIQATKYECSQVCNGKTQPFPPPPQTNDCIITIEFSVKEIDKDALKTLQDYHHKKKNEDSEKAIKTFDKSKFCPEHFDRLDLLSLHIYGGVLPLPEGCWGTYDHGKRALECTHPRRMLVALVEKFPKILSYSNQKGTPLLWEIEDDYPHLLTFAKSLLKEPIPIGYRQTRINIAIQNGSLEEVKLRIQNSHDPNEANYNGETPLLTAIALKEYNIAQYLIGLNRQAESGCIDLRARKYGCNHHLNMYRPTQTLELCLQNNEGIDILNTLLEQLVKTKNETVLINLCQALLDRNENTPIDHRKQYERVSFNLTNMCPLDLIIYYNHSELLIRVQSTLDQLHPITEEGKTLKKQTDLYINHQLKLIDELKKTSPNKNPEDLPIPDLILNRYQSQGKDLSTTLLSPSDLSIRLGIPPTPLHPISDEDMITTVTCQNSESIIHHILQNQTQKVIAEQGSKNFIREALKTNPRLLVTIMNHHRHLDRYAKEELLVHAATTHNWALAKSILEQGITPTRYNMNQIVIIEILKSENKELFDLFLKCFENEKRPIRQLILCSQLKTPYFYEQLLQSSVTNVNNSEDCGTRPLQHFIRTNQLDKAKQIIRLQTSSHTPEARLLLKDSQNESSLETIVRSPHCQYLIEETLNWLRPGHGQDHYCEELFYALSKKIIFEEGYITLLDKLWLNKQKSSLKTISEVLKNYHPQKPSLQKQIDQLLHYIHWLKK